MSSWHHTCFISKWTTLIVRGHVLTGRRDTWTSTIVNTALGCALFFGNSAAVAQSTKPSVQADISHLGDTAHLEFRGLKNWRYEVQKAGPKKITLNVPAVSLESVTRRSDRFRGCR
jgi:hypothetical protein